MFIIISIILFLVLIVLITSFISFYMCFYCSNKKKILDPLYFMEDIVGEKYKGEITDELKKLSLESKQVVYTKSEDGLTLYGNYYETKKGAPIVLFFHGYKSSMYSDGFGAYYIAKECGYNYLTVSQRGHGRSEGNVTSFGIKEKYDVLSWLKFIADNYGEDTPVILAGISMGASTVMMATSLKLPPSVKAILSDCGYNSHKEVIKLKIKKMHLPVWLFFPFMCIGAKLFGNFSLNEKCAEKCLLNNEIPIVFFEGKKDDIVPPYMIEREYNANKGAKKLISFENATHGICFPENPKVYKEEFIRFLKQNTAI